MKWSSERYARLYTRDTSNWVSGPWQARVLLPLVVRKLDRAGTLDLDDNGLEGLAAMILIPVEVVQVGMAWWEKKGTLVLKGSILTMPNFVEAQECVADAALRAKDYRDRKAATKRDDSVTSRDDSVTGTAVASPLVTASHAVPCRAVPNQPNQSPLPPEGDGEELPSARPSGELPKSEAKLWGPEWMASYERSTATALGRPWAFERRQLSSLEQVVESFCTDRTRIAEWIARAAKEFVKATQDAEPSMWSSYQPRGMLRWFNEGRPGYRPAPPPRPPGPARPVAPTEPEVSAETAAANAAAAIEMLQGFGKGGSPVAH